MTHSYLFMVSSFHLTNLLMPPFPLLQPHIPLPQPPNLLLHLPHLPSQLLPLLQRRLKPPHWYLLRPPLTLHDLLIHRRCQRPPPTDAHPKWLLRWWWLLRWRLNTSSTLHLIIDPIHNHHILLQLYLLLTDRLVVVILVCLQWRWWWWPLYLNALLLLL